MKRRQFLRRSTAFAATALGGPAILRASSPNSMLQVACIGVGGMGDMGCHHFDTSFDALELTAPDRVRQTTPGSSGPLWGKRRVVEMVFPGTPYTAGPTVQLTWHDGGIEPDGDKIKLPPGVDRLPESGTYWIGERGSIFKNYRGGRPVVLSPDGRQLDGDVADPPPQNHYHDWVDAVIEGRRAYGEFSHGGPLSETVLVGATDGV